MQNKELTQLVVDYYKLHEKIKQLEDKIQPIAKLLKESVPEGNTTFGEYVVIKTHYPPTVVEQFTKNSYDRLEVRKKNK